MKKSISLFTLLLACSFLLMSCSNSKIEIPKDNIVEIGISTLPYSDSYERIYTDSEKIAAVVDYLSGLKLKDNFPENPDEYAGMAFIITVSYEDGKTEKYNHFGNMFLGKIEDDKIDWYRMAYKDAEQFYTVVQKNLSDN